MQKGVSTLKEFNLVGQTFGRGLLGPELINKRAAVWQNKVTKALKFGNTVSPYPKDTLKPKEEAVSFELNIKKKTEI